MANHEGPIVERSERPGGTGSWSVLAFDQIRVRVEYTAFEPPDRVAVAMTFSGPGSGGMSSTAAYRLLPIIGTGGTRVTIDADGSGGVIIRALNRLTWPLVWRRLRDRMQRGIV
ncbi:MAG: hypothetical protein QOI37_993 [Chloroflexota bacterium]|jgi:hypothetical protein|nr:hypothetical protein [Chloroflexota bacterium]